MSQHTVICRTPININYFQWNTIEVMCVPDKFQERLTRWKAYIAAFGRR